MSKNLSKFLARYLLAFIFVMINGLQESYATSADDSREDWMNSKFDNITNFIPQCIEAPEFPGIQTRTTNLKLDNNKWSATSAYVEKDKALRFEWDTGAVQPRPNKYKLLFRIDPRFQTEEVFIQKYDYVTDKYLSDFHSYKNGILLKYQDNPYMTFLDRIKDFTDYFTFVNRDKIRVNKGDVVNITLDYDKNFFGTSSQMNQELGSLDDLTVIYSSSSIADNKLMYFSGNTICKYIKSKDIVAYNENCKISPVNPLIDYYFGLKNDWKLFEGYFDNPTFQSSKSDFVECSANDPSDKICYLEKARGFSIDIDGKIIKTFDQKFTRSPYTNKDLFYYKSESEGFLNFHKEWKLDLNQVVMTTPIMKDWVLYNNYEGLLSGRSSYRDKLSREYIYFGRYLMDIEIGNSLAKASQAKLDQIKVEYIITDGLPPSETTSGTTIDPTYKTNANQTGFLFVRVTNPNSDITGAIKVKTTYYTGSTWFSTIVYDKLVKPLREKFNELSKLIYTKLITNSALQNIIKTMLVLYIIVYGLVFLAGAIQISVQDIVTRVVKISIVVALISETSWDFFNDNLFTFFIEGTDQLLSSVTVIKSQEGNIFGFIDPIFDKYTNGTLWGLLFIQLLQIHTGLTFFAIITMFSVLTYFRAVLWVVVSYCLAFLSLAVMISIAPLFIILMLFEKTKPMFDNWLSLLFSYMVQPTILLIFILIIDQVIGDSIIQTVLKACWGILIPIKIGLDLNHIGIPISFSFSLPFLPGIPFYIPEVAPIGDISDFFHGRGTYAAVATGTLTFFILTKLAEGLVDYVTLVVEYLTNVRAARQNGQLQSSGSPISGVESDLRSLARPMTGAFNKLKNFGKEKFSDQKISNRFSPSQKNINYENFSNNQSSETENKSQNWKSARPTQLSSGQESAENKAISQAANDMSSSASATTQNPIKATQPNISPNEDKSAEIKLDPINKETKSSNLSLNSEDGGLTANKQNMARRVTIGNRDHKNNQLVDNDKTASTNTPNNKARANNIDDKKLNDHNNTKQDINRDNSTSSEDKTPSNNKEKEINPNDKDKKN